MPKPRKTFKGEMNRIIDKYVHPHFKDYPTLILVDGLLHAIIEQNPKISIQKFRKYSLSELLRCLYKRR